ANPWAGVCLVKPAAPRAPRRQRLGDRPGPRRFAIPRLIRFPDSSPKRSDDHSRQLKVRDDVSRLQPRSCQLDESRKGQRAVVALVTSPRPEPLLRGRNSPKMTRETTLLSINDARRGRARVAPSALAKEPRDV